MTQRSRRWCATTGVVVCLLTGLVVSIAVAWWIALSRTPTFSLVHRVGINIAPPGAPEYNDSVDYVDEYRPGFTNNVMRNNGNVVAVDRRLAGMAAKGVEKLKFLEWLSKSPNPSHGYLYPAREPRWPEWVMMPADGEKFVMLSGRAAGWPWLCLSQRSGELADGTKVSVGGVRVFPTTRYSRWSTNDAAIGEVPLLPVWPGLVKNTLAFGAAWGVVVMLPSAMVIKMLRARRRRLGLCELCGYELGGAGVCPECGGAKLNAV